MTHKRYTQINPQSKPLRSCGIDRQGGGQVDDGGSRGDGPHTRVEHAPVGVDFESFNLRYV